MGRLQKNQFLTLLLTDTEGVNAGPGYITEPSRQIPGQKAATVYQVSLNHYLTSGEAKFGQQYLQPGQVKADC